MRLWYKDAIIYAIDVERFYDSDGDGHGDFNGLIEKLDYLHDLGVNTIWLLPFYPSPNKDNGYDISDYYSVDNRVGTAGDFVELLSAARNRGLRVICDLVVNHTSKEHPWFEASRNRLPRYEDYYVWSDEPEPDDEPAFPQQEDSVWEYDEKREQYYYHTFYKHMPDLNPTSEAVMEEIERVMAFWLELGVMGFRIDGAAPMTRPAKGRHDHSGLFKDFRTRLRYRRGDAVLLAEVDDTPERIPKYAADGEGAQLLFNFILNGHLWHALAKEQAEPLINGLRISPELPEPSSYANFLRNLDELNLARIPKHAREEVIEALAPDGDVRIFERGIRRRLAPLLDDDPARLRLAYSILFSLPGVPVIVYGDEIGMGDDLSQDGREAVRTAMQWSDEENGGFSQNPEIPVISGGDYGYENRNVRELIQDRGSLLHHVRDLIRVRKRSPILTRGEFTLLDSGSKNLLAYAYARDESALVCLHNMGGSQEQVPWQDLTDQLELSKQELQDAENVLEDDQYTRSTKNVRLNPYGYRWLFVRS